MVFLLATATSCTIPQDVTDEEQNESNQVNEGTVDKETTEQETQQSQQNQQTQQSQQNQSGQQGTQDQQGQQQIPEWETEGWKTRVAEAATYGSPYVYVGNGNFLDPEEPLPEHLPVLKDPYPSQYMIGPWYTLTEDEKAEIQVNAEEVLRFLMGDLEFTFDKKDEGEESKWLIGCYEYTVYSKGSAEPILVFNAHPTAYALHLPLDVELNEASIHSLMETNPYLQRVLEYSEINAPEIVYSGSITFTGELRKNWTILQVEEELEKRIGNSKRSIGLLSFEKELTLSFGNKKEYELYKNYPTVTIAEAEAYLYQEGYLETGKTTAKVKMIYSTLTTLWHMDMGIQYLKPWSNAHVR